MPKIDKILILGKNSRSINIYEYLLSNSYSVSLGDIPVGAEKSFNIEQQEIAFEALDEFSLVILAGVSRIFETTILKLPKFGMLTCHAGALPEYRGSSPLSWSLLNGEKFIGLSVIQTATQIDGGHIYSSARFDIDKLENIDDLHNLADESFPFLVHTAILNIENNISPVKQISNFQGYYPLRNRDDSRIHFSIMTAEYIKRLFNSINPRYGNPYFTFHDTEVEVLSVDIRQDFHGVPGKIYQILGNKILVACTIDAVWLSLKSTKELELFKRYGIISSNGNGNGNGNGNVDVT